MGRGALQALAVGPHLLMRAQALGVATEMDPIVEGLDRVMAGGGYGRRPGPLDMALIFSPGGGMGERGAGVIL